uniref:Cubilin n=2 Tax=Parascaris univalens TaxID=6257 RepID=A0A914ZMM1_PARUN
MNYAINDRWKLATFILVILTFIHRGCNSESLDDITIFNEDETRSRLLMLNGHMYFHAGKEKNITFVAGAGGSIFFGEKDLNLLPQLVDFETLKGDVGNAKVRLQQVIKSADVLKYQIKLKSGDIASLNRKIANITRRLSSLNNTKKDGMGRKLRGLLNAVKAHLVLLDVRLKKDECAEAPCQNGGTCVDLYNKFLCICPSSYEGAVCESRVDECALYEGTHAGCQNNGTCVNKPTGFQCICRKGYHGRLCQIKGTACEFSLDLCGSAGHCIPAPPVDDSSEPGYRCLCEWGYRSSTDKANPTCEDINECESNPCYPGSSCINLPGSFKCSGCPAGMTGNGINCFDIDECADSDAVTCSKDPLVQCINTIGSFTCAPCPPGYRGDGRICTKKDPCETAPCYPGAKCFNMGSSSLNEGGFRCECPRGMIGDGIGKEGCYRSNVTLCHSDTCYNQGTCQVISETEYLCHCEWGYAGKRCEYATACLNNICGGRGECIPKADASFECKCIRGYYGNKCQFEEDGCGGHSTNTSGVIKYPDWTWYHFGRNKSCEWTIVVNEPNKIIQITFTNFHLPSSGVDSVVCSRADANVTLRDGDSSNSPLVGVYCGHRGSSS